MYDLFETVTHDGQESHARLGTTGGIGVNRPLPHNSLPESLEQGLNSYCVTTCSTQVVPRVDSARVGSKFGPYTVRTSGPRDWIRSSVSHRQWR